MVPSVMPGDLVVAHPVQPGDLQPGDLIMFQYGRAIVGHRLVSATAVGSPGLNSLPDDELHWRLVTRGDALENPDPPIPGEALVGKVVLVIPWAGWMVSDTVPIEYGSALLFLLWSIGAMQRLPISKAASPLSRVAGQAVQTEIQP